MLKGQTLPKREKPKFKSAFIQDFETILVYADVPMYQDYKFVINNFKPDTPVEVLELSVRAENSLKRNGVKTFEQLRTCDLNRIRGCGKGTIKEIRTKFLSYCYAGMNDEQRIRFWKDTYALTAKAHGVA